MYFDRESYRRDVGSGSQRWRELTIGAKVFISLVVMAGTCVLLYGAIRPTSKNIAQFICYLLIAILAARLKVRLPGITGTMSVNFLFILLGILELGFAETLALATGAILVQCFYRDRPSPLQVTFNLSASAISIAIAYSVYHLAISGAQVKSHPLLLGLAAISYFAANTGSIAAVIALTEQKSIKNLWVECYFWSFPYYLVGAAFAGMIGWFNREFGWETSLLIVPIIYLIYRSYRLYLGKLEDEKRHVEEMATLHLRTIEALALAIEAKDHTTHDHLQRVRVYAIEVAKELHVTADEMEALHAAALLHDIGKLAVPEHIISKPGRLTPEEFEKMKIHPLVGAEILERVRFPYPVVPIVRAHHEKWDGSGYPFGLKGEEIPIGARILSSVDFLDAMASDRQYRRALPLEEVMKRLSAESGKSFDPKVVSVLERRYRQLEKLVESTFRREPVMPLSTEMKVEAGAAPAAGFEDITVKDAPGQEANFLSSIAAARQEAQTLFELSQDLGASLSLGETLSVFSVKLRRLVPYDAIAIYVKRDAELVPEHVSGDNHRLFSSLRIPLGQRPLRLGGPEPKTHHQRQPLGGTGVSQRSDQVQHAALGAGDSSGRAGRRSGRARPLSRGNRCLHFRPLAHPAGHQFEDGAGHRKRREVRASRKFGCHRLPDRTAQRPLAVPATGPRTGALQARHHIPGRHGQRYGRLQADQRPLRPPGRQSRAPPVRTGIERELPRVRLRGPHGRRRVCGGGAGPDRGGRPPRRRKACVNWRGRPARKCAARTFCR